MSKVFINVLIENLELLVIKIVECSKKIGLLRF